MIECQSYEWFSIYRKDALRRLDSVRNPIDESSKRKIRRVNKIKSEICELESRITKLKEDELRICPHPNDKIMYDEVGNQDDYGRWIDYINYRLTCVLCGKVLDKWDNAEICMIVNMKNDGEE